MSKSSQDREDLLRDARAYDIRIELKCAGFAENVFCGFRSATAMSVYFGQQTVLQFNSKNELRRAFWRDRMMASYQHELYWIVRDQTTEVGAARMQMSRELLTDSESSAFLDFATTSLTQLASCLERGSYTSVGQFPRDVDVAARVCDWLTDFGDSISLSASPGVVGR